MKCKLIILLIALLIPTFGFSQQLIKEKKNDDIIARIKQIQQDRPDAERQVQRLLEELNMDMCSPMAVRELSRLVRQDAPEELLRRQLQLLTERYGRDHRDRRAEPRSSLPVTTADNQPLTAEQQAVIAQVLEDFQVNENVGRCNHELPRICRDFSGNTMIVWRDERNGNGDIYVQCLNSNGAAQGANSQVNDDGGSSNHWHPVIASDSSGNFLVVWCDNRNGYSDIYAQRYSSKGVKQGSNFRVNDDGGRSYQYMPDVAADANGNFVVVWEDRRNRNTDIYGQRYNNKGETLGTNFLVSKGLTPAVAVDNGGYFMVVWQDGENEEGNIYGQFYTNSGFPMNTKFQVNDKNGSININIWTPPAVASDYHNNFLVVWTDKRNRAIEGDIYAQRYNISGTPNGDNFCVNDKIGSCYSYQPPKIASDYVGNFVVVWADSRNGNYDIYAQRYRDGFMPDGANFLVNDDCNRDQQWFPSVAVDGRGDFMVVWEDHRNRSNSDIYAQYFNDRAQPEGVNFQVNDDKGSGWQVSPAISVDTSGNFTIVWKDEGTLFNSIYAQCYNSNGICRGKNFQVSEISVYQYFPDIGFNGYGNFVVIWTGDGVFAQRYYNDGTPRGMNFLVNDRRGSLAHYPPAIAMDIIGNFVVVWYDIQNGNIDIYARSFDSSGVVQGDIFQVNDDNGNSIQESLNISMDVNGNFTVVWHDKRNGNYDIYAQRYNSNGVVLGANFLVNNDSGSSDQLSPVVAAGGSGNFMVVWQDRRNGNSDIYAQCYSSSGIAQRANFRINDDSGSSGQYSPAIASDSSGNFVVVWTDNRNGNCDIYAQLFDSEGQKIGSNYRVNNDTGTKDQLSPDVKLVNGHIYYTWQDNRIEGQGYDIFARVDKFNFAPAAPGLSSPQNNSTITTDKPALTFTVPVDDNNDPLHFKVEISRNSSFTSPISGSPFESKNNPSGFSQTPPLPSGTGTCSFTVPTALTNGDYWWRVSAWDGTVYGSASEAWKFTVSVTPVYLQPVVNDHSLHQEFYVDIQIKDAQNLFGVAFKLNFPADQLETLSAEKGDFLGTDPVFFPDINNSAGVVSGRQQKKWPAGCQRRRHCGTDQAERKTIGRQRHQH